MKNASVLRLTTRHVVATDLFQVRDPDDILTDEEGEGVVAFTIELKTSKADFLSRYSKLRNLLKKLQHDEVAAKDPKAKIKSAITWVRKKAAEVLLTGIIDDLQEDLVPMFKAVGDLPAEKASDKAWEDYADRAYEWQKKQRG
jgi:hypothetical protein